LFVLSPGQTRLRELVEETARTIDPDATWWPAKSLEHAKPGDRRAGIMLEELRASTVRDPIIVEDTITGQQLDQPPVSCTYAQAQRYAGLAETVSRAPINADAIVNCRGGSTRRGLACCGVDKPHTVYGALTWLALGRRLPSPEDADATLLRGSRIVICGSGGHHRTLACFLWGAGELAGKITIVDELADEELHAACRLIDSRLPNPTQGLAIRAHPHGHATQRAQLLELAQRLEALRPLSEKDLRWVSVPNLEDVIDDVDSMGRLRHLWLRRPSPARSAAPARRPAGDLRCDIDR
jgi:hypothetical protein